MQIDLSRGASVGIAVRDLEPVIELYAEGLGIGPFEMEEIEAPAAEYCEGSSNRSAPTRMRIATAPFGVCELEIIEVLAGRPPHLDFLEAEGEGMNHVNLDTLSAENYLDTLDRLYWREIEPFWGLPFGGFCYVESDAIGGVSFEIMVGSGKAGKKAHNHLGLVVEETDRTIDFYSKALGLGPFRTGDHAMPRAAYREKRIETTFRASFCEIGNTSLRLYQVLAGDTPLTDRIRERGEGLHHLCLNVADLEESLTELSAVGVEATWRCPELRMAHLDTTRIGGMTFSLAEVD